MEELAPERAAVKAALAELLIDAWVFETDAGARPTSIQKTYLKELDEVDLYIGIFWKGYGEYTIEEFDYARAKGKDCLIYEKREAIESARDPALQDFLNRLSKVESGLTIRWFNRPEELASFIKQDVAAWQTEIVRRARRPQLTAPFQAPPQSDRYVDRVQLHTSLKAAVLPSTIGSRPSLTRVVLHGIGGAGKTSVAIAFAHDPDVRRAYPDGVLWIDLGQTPNLLQLQSRLGRALEDPKAANLGYPDSPTAESQLRTLLQDRACLLVVDDAWKGDDVADAFLVGGPRCLLLVTTRQAEVAKKLDAEVFELGSMAEAEALALFERWSGPLQEKDSETARWLAKQVDYLPLALELIGAQIGRVDGWSEYRSSWEEQRLASLKRGRRATGVKDNVLDSLELSVRALQKDDRRAYLQTAAFPPGATFPASAAAALWNMREREASELLLDLADQALVSRREHGGKTWFGLHALLQDYVVAASGAEGVVHANRNLIDGYRKRYPNGWASAKDDGYLFNNLTYHLAAAGETADLYSLVDKSWMQAQFARSESHRPFAQDVERALQMADSEQPRNWTMMARCRYVVGGLQAQAADMSIEFLEVLGRTGRIGRALEAAALLPDAWRRAAAFRKLAEVMIESGAFDEASNAIRWSVEAIDAAQYPYKQYVAEGLAIAAEQMFRCGNQTEAKELLVRASTVLQSVPELENRCYGWNAVVRAQVAIEGNEVALRSAESWLEEIEASSGDDLMSAAAHLSEIFSIVGIAPSEFFDRLLKVALYLHQQGRDDWALAETIGALARYGAVARACDLLPIIGGASNSIRATIPCAEAAHKVGNQELTEQILSKLYDSVEAWAKEGSWIETKLFTPLIKIVIEAQGQSGLVQLTRALAAPSDPVWRAFNSSLLAVAAAALGDANAAARHAAESARVLNEALQSAPLDGEIVRADTAIALVEAGHLDAAISVVNGIADRVTHASAFCQVALKLLEQGDTKQAETIVERALSEAAVSASADATEISAACVAAEALRRIGAAEPARAILEAALSKVLLVPDTERAPAFVRLAAALNLIGEHSQARDAVRNALALFDSYSWIDSGFAQCFEIICTLYDDADLDEVLAKLNDNWFRRSNALAGVVKGLIARGQTERAQKYYDEVRQSEQDYAPWSEAGKAESLVELARLDDERVLEWLKDGGGLFEPALRARMLGHEAAAWIRLKQIARAETALQHALDLCTEISDGGIRHDVLSGIGQELAAAGAYDPARRAVEKIAAGTEQDDALRAIALELIKTPQSADAVHVVAMVQDPVRRDQTFAEVAEKVADAGDYDTALACARQTQGEQWTPYIAATVARRLVIAERRDEARVMLQHVDAISASGNPDLNDLVLARKAQVQALLGDKEPALTSATAALDLAVYRTGPFVWAWCAEAFAHLGDMDRAATAAEQALESLHDYDDEWTQAGHLEIAAGALVAAKALDEERLLKLVRGFENEYVRAHALGKVYPYVRNTIPNVAKELFAVIRDMKDAWAQADAVAALAECMAQRGDRADLHALLPIAEAIDNKWASAHAIGRLASAVAVGGDPDDLTQALKSMAGYKLPAWRRAAALAMAALALRRVGELDRSSDLANEALNVAMSEEDYDLGKRGQHAVSCAHAALSLGDRAEAERQAELAQTCFARISRRSIYTGSYIDALFNLASKLGSAEHVDRALELCSESEDRSLFYRATSESGVRLARMGHCSTAREQIDRALSDVDSFGTDTAGMLYADAAFVAHSCGEPDRAANYFSSALRVHGSREMFATVLETNVDLLSSIDQGTTLARIFATLREVDAWWQP
jgi:tetratricopeptide (TPR) repeat protein